MRSLKVFHSWNAELLGNKKQRLLILSYLSEHRAVYPGAPSLLACFPTSTPAMLGAERPLSACLFPYFTLPLLVLSCTRVCFS